MPSSLTPSLRGSRCDGYSRTSSAVAACVELSPDILDTEGDLSRLRRGAQIREGGCTAIFAEAVSSLKKPKI